MSTTDLLTTVLPVALPLLAPFLFALYKRLIESLPAAKRRAVESIVSSAVPAAEQVYASVPGSGKAKKLWVESQIKAILGTRINPALVDIFIEEAVSLLNEGKQPEPTGTVGFNPPTQPVAAPQPVPAL